MHGFLWFVYLSIILLDDNYCQSHLSWYLGPSLRYPPIYQLVKRPAWLWMCNWYKSLAFIKGHRQSLTSFQDAPKIAPLQWPVYGMGLPVYAKYHHQAVMSSAITWPTPIYGPAWSLQAIELKWNDIKVQGSSAWEYRAQTSNQTISESEKRAHGTY